MLMQIKAIKLNPHNPFRWASGLYSPIYCDNRLALSYPRLRRMIIDGMVDVAADFGPSQVIAGVATAGIPHGVLLADRLDLPFVYVRSKAKEHGRNNLIEGEVRGYERVLVIEDLFSTGGSAIQAAEVIESQGCQIAGILSVFSYDLPALRHNMQEAEYAFGSLTNYDAVLEVALRENLFSDEAIEVLKNWRHDPAAWSAAFSSQS